MKEFIDKLIERLEELKELHAELIKDGLEEDYHSGCEGMCVDIIEIVNQLAEEYKREHDDTDYANIELYAFWKNHQWIPCSEKQPPKPRFKEDTYLIQQSDVIAPYSAYWNGECWTDVLNDKLDNVIAWMPLPAPYTEGEAELYRAKSVDGEYQEYKGDWK